MNIYLITCDTEEVEYNYYSGHVIIADNEHEVREVAKILSTNEGKEVWDKAHIEFLGEYTKDVEKPFMVLSSFHANKQ